MIEHLTAETFKEKVFDYENEKEWKYKGDKPAIIDFYADWCGPCRLLAPILEEIDKEYQGKLQIYKIDTEVEQDARLCFWYTKYSYYTIYSIRWTTSNSCGCPAKK